MNESKAERRKPQQQQQEQQKHRENENNRKNSEPQTNTGKISKYHKPRSQVRVRGRRTKV